MCVWYPPQIGLMPRESRMGQEDTGNTEAKRAELIAQMRALEAEIKLIAQRLVAHEGTPNFFKGHPVVKEIVK